MRDEQGNNPRRRFMGVSGAAALGLAGAAIASGDSRKTPASTQVQHAQDRRRSGGIAKGAPSSGSEGDSAITPTFAVQVLNRMGYGPARRIAGQAPGGATGSIFASGFESPDQTLLGDDDVAFFESLGTTDEARLAAYVSLQLEPDSIADTELDSRMAQFPNSFSELDRSLGATFNELECTGFNNYVRPLRQVEKATFLRAVYSRRQLFELISEFWRDHLNIFGGADEDTYVSWASWDRQVIRAHAFGNFYHMLIASARHPAMLRYLDNYENSAGGFNENYARELFELHTLGAENYLGPVGYDEVEFLPENPYTALNDQELIAAGFADPNIQVAAAYIDDDVYEAARALTGWRYRDENEGNNCGTGAFFTDEGDHDGGRKGVLTGLVSLIDSDGEAEPDGRIVIKLAAYHPATARYIARKLCRRLISDDPPQSVIDAAAATFMASRKRIDQIQRTLETILLSPEFADSARWGEKIKRPFEYTVSAMRAAGCNYTWRHDDRTSDDFLNRYQDAGQRLFWWRTPDGYPDQRDHWQGTTSMVQCWRTVDWLLDRDAREPDRVMQVLDLTLANIGGNPTPRRLVNFWLDWILGFTPAGGWTGPEFTAYINAPTTLGRVCLQFMVQQGFGSGRDDDIWSEDEGILRADLAEEFGQYSWHRRLRGMVKLILWSPQFMQR